MWLTTVAALPTPQSHFGQLAFVKSPHDLYALGPDPEDPICCVEIDWFSRCKNQHELKFQTMWKNKLEEEK